MPVCRVIFRVDFKANFEIMDAPGAIMASLVGAKKDFWSEVGHNAGSHQVVAVYTSADRTVFRQLTVEPKCIVVSYETASGISLKAPDEDEALATMLESATEIAAEYEVDQVIRMGYRVFYFSKLGPEAKSTLAAFRSLTGTAVVDGVETILGRTQDFGFAISGESEDKVRYRLLAGPFAADTEPANYLENISQKELGEKYEYNFVCDMDLADRNFSLAKVPLQKWVRSLVGKRASAITKLEETVLSRIGQ